MIKTILVVASLLILFWFLSNYKTTKGKAWVKICAVMFISITVSFVMFPEMSNRIAHFMGVGRGADLILYMTVISFIAFGLLQYVKSKEDRNKIVTLARKIAIIESNMENRKN